ncbi:hypothetical protein FE257_000666 [Aspergillus nanangensis]|uniref:Uncharacterized protein n=1 Tax=Aspergillus nanangensis TaxID=2582783 RepID=A0AAD4CEP8_ASPNN|nr:hypothetical protein FE257_000666 [Aspergillus nanangensis]
MPSSSQVPQSSDLQGLNLVNDLTEPSKSPTPTSNHVAQEARAGLVSLSQDDTLTSGHGGHPTESIWDNESSQSTEEDLPMRELTDLTAHRAVINEKLESLTSAANQISELKARINHVEESLSHSAELSAVLLSLIDSFEEQLSSNLGLVNDVNAGIKGTARVVENLLAHIANRRDHGHSG